MLLNVINIVKLIIWKIDKLQYKRKTTPNSKIFELLCYKSIKTRGKF